MFVRERIWRMHAVKVLTTAPPYIKWRLPNRNAICLYGTFHLLSATLIEAPVDVGVHFLRSNISAKASLKLLFLAP